MPIILPNGLPAAATLRREGVAVVGPESVREWRSPPLRVLLVNLMPDKQRTEAQFARLLGGSQHRVALTLAVPGGHVWRTAGPQHIDQFYSTWNDICWQRFDGLIVTGAPVEKLAFEDVDYWDALSDIIDWATAWRLPSIYVCWAAQAALWRRFAVPKHCLAQKRFGVYRHQLSGTGLTTGLGGEMTMPVSRHTETRISDLPNGMGLRVAAVSRDSGLGMVEEPSVNAAYIFNHPEYDETALADEYTRDIGANQPIGLPENYFEDDDPALPPVAAWQEKTRRLYANWLDQVAAVRRNTVFCLPAPPTDSPALRAARAAFGHIHRPTAA